MRQRKFYKSPIALLAMFLLMPYSVFAKTDMGTIDIKVGETMKITSEPSTTYSVSGTWSKSGEAISIVSKLDRSCTIWGVKEGTATLEWSGLINTTREDMYWTINVTDPGKHGGGGNNGTPDTGFSDNWTSNGNYTISWFDNSKSEYHISTAKELAGLAYLVNNGYSDFKGKTVKLDADIDLDGKNWQTIGDGYNYIYYGAFDGQNHTISGVYIVCQHEKQKHYGFWALVADTSIKNIRMQGKVSIESSTKMTGGFDTNNYPGYSFIGGLVGFAHNVYFENCKIEMDVKYRRDHNNSYLIVGGIAGVCRNSSSSSIAMKNCSHIGNLYAGEWSESNYGPIVGGLIGWSGLSFSSGKIEYCENISSEIYCSQTRSSDDLMYYSVGGLIGEGNPKISYCRNIVDKMTVKNNCNDLLHLFIGGVGAGKQPSINCYSIVKEYNINSVTLKSYSKTALGGITAESVSTSAANFSNSDVKNNSSISLQEGYHGSTSYTSSQMKSSDFLDELNTYSQLNLGKAIWGVDDDGYPCIEETHYFGKQNVPITSITLNKTSLSLQPGQSETLTATVKPDNATDKSVEWTSSKTSVATVDSNGKVTAISEGTATITCKANDGSGVYATCSVTVTELHNYPEPNLVSVVCKNSNPLQLTNGDNIFLTATFSNNGVAGDVRTVAAIMAKDEKLTYVKVGEETSDYFAASQNTILDYSLSLKEVPEGDYYASVLYYKQSDDEDVEGWYYKGKWLLDIHVGNSSGSCPKGDVNCDGSVNGTDLVALTNIVLGKNAQTESADVNGDGRVNGTDYVALVNIILGRANARKATFNSLPEIPQKLTDINNVKLK